MLYVPSDSEVNASKHSFDICRLERTPQVYKYFFIYHFFLSENPLLRTSGYARAWVNSNKPIREIETAQEPIRTRLLALPCNKTFSPEGLFRANYIIIEI